MRSSRLLAPLVLALAACSSSTAATSGPAVEELEGRMPRLAGRTLDGGAVRPEDYAGRVVVANFWATWCAPCRRELPILSAAHAGAGPDGPFFVGVDFRDDAGAAREYLAELDVAYPSLSDPDGDLAYRFGVPFLPTTVVIDADGRLRYRITGEIDAVTLRDLLREVEAP